jgi:hypothetical protein
MKMLDSLTQKKILLRFRFKTGQDLLREMTETEARSVVDNWTLGENAIIGCTSQKDPASVWAVRASEIMFLDIVLHEWLEQQAAAQAAAAQQRQQQNPGMPQGLNLYRGAS